MPRLIQPQNSFNGGEISPDMYSRTNFNKYASSIKTGTNCDLTIIGPAKKRKGSQFIQQGKNNTSTVLVPFVVDETKEYLLEFSPTSIRFFKSDKTPVLSAGSPFEIVISESLTDFSWHQDGNRLYLNFSAEIGTAIAISYLEKGTGGDTDWSFVVKQLIPPPTNELGEIPSTTFTLGATTGTGVTCTASAATFLASDVGRQIVFLGNTSGRASITGFTSTTVVTVDILEDYDSVGPHSSWAIDLSPIASVTPSGSTVGSIITLTGAINTWRSGDVGKYVYINGGVVLITIYTSATVVSGEVQKALTATSATTNWTLEEQAWGANSLGTGGTPTVVSIYQNRFIFAGSSRNEGTVFFSRTGFFTDFGRGSEDDDSIVIKLTGKKSSEVAWVREGRDLLVGTKGFVTDIKSDGASLTPTDRRSIVRTDLGSPLQIPISLSGEIIFFPTTLNQIVTYRYSFDTDSYLDEDLLLFADHLVGTSTIVRLASVNEPNPQVYILLSNGDLLVGILQRSQQVIGWTRYATDGNYVDIATINTSVGDQVWVSVDRVINGTTTRMVEVFDSGDGSDNIHGFSDSFLTLSDPKTITNITQANPAVVTSASHGFSNGDDIKIIDVVGMTEINNKSYLVANSTTNTFELTDLEGTNIDSTSFTAYSSGGEAHELVNSVSGLDHLEGETVELKVDGGSHPTKVVSSGSVTLDSAAYEVTAGLPYTMTVVTLNKEFNVGIGSQQAQQSRWPRPILHVVGSFAPSVNGQEAPSRKTGDTMDVKVPLFTGFLYYGDAGWGRTGSLTITSQNPFPCNITGLFGLIEGGVT